MIKRLIGVAFIIHLCSFSMGQTTRVEIKLNRAPNDVEVISLREKGFLLFYTGGEKRGNSFNSWNITKFNKNFEEQWNKLLDIPSRFSIENSLYDSAGNRFLYISRTAAQLRIDILDLNDGMNSSQTYSLNKHNQNITSSCIFEDNLYLLLKYGPDGDLNSCYSSCCLPLALPLSRAGLSVFKYGSIYVRINLKEQLKYERVEIGKGMAIPDKIRESCDTSESVFVSFFQRKPHSHGGTSLTVKHLDQKLNTSDSLILVSPEGLSIQNIQLVCSQMGYAAVGTFNNKPPEPEEFLNTIDAQGFYTAIINRDKSINAIKIIRFSELKSFEKYMLEENTGTYTELSEARKERLKKRYKNYSTLLRFNEIIERDNDFIATAEAFYPVYSTYRDANGNLVRYFDGYDYTHGLIICFDKKGNLKWDQTIPFNFNRLYLTINQKIKVLQNGENIQLSYSSGGNMNIIRISGDNISEPENQKLPRLLKEDEKASEYMSDVTPWYGEKYLMWGFQKIRKSDIKTREGSNVIYMDEINLR